MIFYCICEHGSLIAYRTTPAVTSRDSWRDQRRDKTDTLCKRACNLQCISARHDAWRRRCVGTKVANFKKKNRSNFKFCCCKRTVSTYAHTRCIVAPLLGYGEPTRRCSSCSGPAVDAVYVGPRQLWGFFTVTANVGPAMCTASLWSGATAKLSVSVTVRASSCVAQSLVSENFKQSTAFVNQSLAAQCIHKLVATSIVLLSGMERQRERGRQTIVTL